MIISTLIIFFLIFKLISANIEGTFEENKVKFAIGYFYFAYKKKFYFWDIVILIRRLLILFVFMFYYDKIFSKDIFPLFLIYLIIIISLFFQSYFNPFSSKYDVLNRAELSSLFILSITYMMTILYSTSLFKIWNWEIQYFEFFMAAIILFNALFLIYWFYLYYSKYLYKKVNFLMATINKQSMMSNKNTQISKSLEMINQHLAKNLYFVDSCSLSSNVSNINFNTHHNLFCIMEKKIFSSENNNQDRLCNNFDKYLTEAEKQSILSNIENRNVFLIEKQNLLNLYHNIEVKIEKNNLINKNINEFKYNRKLHNSNFVDYMAIDTITIIVDKPINIYKYGLFFGCLLFFIF